MSSPETRPSAPEIKEQLQLMLASKRFRNAPSQSGFLALVVKRALEGKRTSERVLGNALLRKKFIKDETTGVRVTAGSLRKSLREYFDKEGSDDPVRILLPEPPEDRSVRPAKGEAYTPLFSYHPFQTVSFSQRMGEALLSRDLQSAADLFREVNATAPGHTAALIGMVEAWCCALLYIECTLDKAAAREISLEALSLLEKVVAQVPTSWKAHAVAGFLVTQMENLGFAEELFAKALLLSRANTESYPPYFAFLVRSGKEDRALRLADRYLESRLSDPNAYVAYADVLLRAEQYDVAAEFLEKTLQIHGYSALVHQRLFMIRFMQRRFDEVLIHGSRMAQSLDPLILEATLECAKKAVTKWPEQEQEVWKRLMEFDIKREEAIRKAIADVQATLKE